MIEKVFPDLYRIEVVLPNNPLRTLNAYVIKGQERSLIIDTGMNRQACIKGMESSLQELEVKLTDADFFITHMHADHSGLVSYFKTETSKVFCSETDAYLINQMAIDDRWDIMRSYIKCNGFPEEELYEAIDNHPGFKYRNKENTVFNIVKEGDILKVGNYCFQCIETPGHSKGHICLYEPDKKVLIAGDHILSDITPNITLWSDEDDPLEEYLKSLQKILQLEVELVLPGHRKIFSHCKDRINELTNHHRKRLMEILKILGKRPMSAFQVASEMTWDIRYSSWSEFPPQQKLFAISEVLAHLQYLHNKGEIRRESHGDSLVYVREAGSDDK